MAKRTRLIIPSSSGSALDAAVVEPDSEPLAYALYAHCFTCTKEIAAAVRVSNELVEHGVAVLRFDFAGLGRSGGDFSKQTFSANVADEESAARSMDKRFHAPRMLIGHSLGGAAVLAAVGSIESAAAVGTIGAASEPRHVQTIVRERGRQDCRPRTSRSNAGWPTVYVFA